MKNSAKQVAQITLTPDDQDRSLVPFKKHIKVIRSCSVAMPAHNACFRTDQRYTCQDWDCEQRSECCRLVATWLRN